MQQSEKKSPRLFPTSLLEMKVMKTSSLTVVVATLGPGASNSELPNFFQFWKKNKKQNTNFILVKVLLNVKRNTSKTKFRPFSLQQLWKLSLFRS